MKNPIKPFSKNIIFFDTEFTSLDPNKSELISMAFVKPDGEELYLELEYHGEPSEWVKENVLPFLKGEKIGNKEAIKRVKEFVGDKKPHMLGYINQDDVIFWQKFFMANDSGDNPFNLISIDFATMLFIYGINPEIYLSENNDQLLQKIDIDPKKYKKHNSLDDAKLLREIYLKFINNPNDFLEYE